MEPVLADSHAACIVTGYGIRKDMARPTRFQYPGAVYHVMARGDGGKVVFETVSNYWIASSLAMGHPGSVSRMISAGRSDRRMSERFHALVKAINNLADPQ